MKIIHYYEVKRYLLPQTSIIHENASNSINRLFKARDTLDNKMIYISFCSCLRLCAAYIISNDNIEIKYFPLFTLDFYSIKLI